MKVSELVKTLRRLQKKGYGDWYVKVPSVFGVSMEVETIEVDEDGDVLIRNMSVDELLRSLEGLPGGAQVKIPAKTGEWDDVDGVAEGDEEIELMPRQRLTATESAMMSIGLGGNLYVYCLRREVVEGIAEMIGKSKSSVYYNKKFRC